MSDTVGIRFSITAGRVDGLIDHANVPLAGTVRFDRRWSTNVCFGPCGDGAPSSTSVCAGSTGEVSVTNCLLSVSFAPAGALPVMRECLETSAAFCIASR